jgi:acyl transferase domain-containing protein
VNQRLRGWERPVLAGREQRRVAGISSFGAGGSNAHLVVEEYVAPGQREAEPAAQEPAAASGLVGIVLSARTAEQLKSKARGLREYLQKCADPVDLRAVAYTLQVGREGLQERVGFVVGAEEKAARV